MSAEDLRLEEPERSERGWQRTVLLMAVPLAAVWAIAFWITGLLWWDAGEAVQQVPPPEAPQIERVDASTIDLERYTTAHPRWEP
jgi:ferric-dicitrate binding protein FerR (iron transport regulator)